MQKTFRDMGIRCAESAALHLLHENTYESELLSDISNVDYLQGHEGRANLQALEGLVVFRRCVSLYLRLPPLLRICHVCEREFSVHDRSDGRGI